MVHLAEEGAVVCWLEEGAVLHLLPLLMAAAISSSSLRWSAARQAAQQGAPAWQVGQDQGQRQTMGTGDRADRGMLKAGAQAARRLPGATCAAFGR